MNDIYMQSKILEVTKIIKKTKAKLFGTLKVGDKIKLKIQVDKVGSKTNGTTYSPIITIMNIKSNECVYKSFNELGRIFSCFEFKEID